MLPHFCTATSKMTSSSTGVPSRLAARFYIELCADAASEFRHMVRRGKYPGQKKQIACLYGFRIGPQAEEGQRDWAIYPRCVRCSAGILSLENNGIVYCQRNRRIARIEYRNRKPVEGGP